MKIKFQKSIGHLFVCLNGHLQRRMSISLAFLTMPQTDCFLTSCFLTYWPNYSLDSKLLIFGYQKETGSLTLTQLSANWIEHKTSPYSTNHRIDLLRFSVRFFFFITRLLTLHVWISYSNFALPLRFWSLRNSHRYTSSGPSELR